MIKGAGIDIESTHRIGKLLGRYERSVLRMIFTAAELERGYSVESPVHYLTICFVAKEAMGKALGTGFATIDWNDIEADVQNDQVVLILHGKALKRAKGIGTSRWQAQWSGWNDQRMVVVVIQ